MTIELHEQLDEECYIPTAMTCEALQSRRTEADTEADLFRHYVIVGDPVEVGSIFNDPRGTGQPGQNIRLWATEACACVLEARLLSMRRTQPGWRAARRRSHSSLLLPRCFRVFSLSRFY
jgi:hypothetical protein